MVINRTVISGGTAVANFRALLVENCFCRFSRFIAFDTNETINQAVPGFEQFGEPDYY